MIRVGSPAPNFSLEDQFGRRFRLADYRGRRAVLLLFFPASFTFTCAREVPALNAMAERFRVEANTAVVAISCDSRFSNLAWAAELGGIRIPMLSDCNPQGAVSRAYGAWLPSDAQSDRATVIVGCDGKVKYSHSVTKGGERDLQGLLAAAREISASCPATHPATDLTEVRGERPGETVGVLYVLPGCGHCRHILRLLPSLGARGIVVRDVTSGQSVMRELVQVTGETNPPTPVLVMGGRTLIGRDQIEQALVARYLGG